MVSYIAGAVAGAAFGSMVGYLKYTALWKGIIRDNRTISTGVLHLHMGMSYAINAAALLFIFLMRDQMPCDFGVVMVAAAVMLSVVGKLAPMSEIVSHVEGKIT